MADLSGIGGIEPRKPQPQPLRPTKGPTKPVGASLRFTGAAQTTQAFWKEIPQTPLGNRTAATGMSAVEGFFPLEPKPVGKKPTITTSFGEFEIDPKILPKIPKGSIMTQADLLADVGAKVERGGALLIALSKGDDIGRKEPTMKDISDLMWFIQIKGEEKHTASYSAGALLLEDPGQNVRKFLDKSPEVYQRSSTHYEDFQRKGDSHRGIDFLKTGPENLDELLPYGRRTLLLGSLSFSKVDKNLSDMLFLKMESHGSWISTAREKKASPDIPKSRPMNRHDVGQFFGHAWGLIKSKLRKIKSKLTGKTSGEPKEHVPPKVKNAYKKLIKEFQELEKGGMLTKEAKIIRQNDPTKAARIMAKNISEIEKDAFFHEKILAQTPDELLAQFPHA